MESRENPRRLVLLWLIATGLCIWVHGTFNANFRLYWVQTGINNLYFTCAIDIMKRNEALNCVL